MLTLARLKYLLSYDPLMGEFEWMVDRGNRIKPGMKAGWINSEGYKEIMIDSVCYKAHRLAWFFVYGEMPVMIDHINRVRSDNRISNLRTCSASQNAMNRKIQKNSKSGTPGVLWNKREEKWKVSAKIKGKRINLGTYSDKELAISAREDFCKKAYAEFYPQA